VSDEQIPLSDREMEILRLVATGATNQQIAQDLTISVNTVKVHLRNVFAKLEVGSRTEATMVAVHQGWVDIPRQTEDLEEEDRGSPVSPPPATEATLLARWSATPLVWRAVLIAVAVTAVALLSVSILRGALGNAGLPEGEIGLTATASAPSSSAAGRWLTRAQMPTPRSGLGVVEHEGLVYTIAGMGDKGATGIVEVYDPQADAWSRLESKPTPVGFVSAAVLDG
jgi:DNA-binding CsgD family transcriptional regulator